MKAWVSFAIDDEWFLDEPEGAAGEDTDAELGQKMFSQGPSPCPSFLLGEADLELGQGAGLSSTLSIV